MDPQHQPVKVDWYRSPVSREQLQALNQRSNFKGWLQTGGYLGLLALTGTLAVASAGRLPWPVVVLLCFIHGMFWAFLINGFHEFVHNSVFQTKSLNWFFARLFAFLGWHNPYEFWSSHTEHHKYTLHPPDDLEVVLPVDLSLKGFLSTGFVNPVGLWQTLSKTIRVAGGKLRGPWENSLFPEAAGKEKRQPGPMGTSIARRSCDHHSGVDRNALVDAAGHHDLRALLWRMAALPLQ